jgi:hypothetical protein
MATYGVPRVGTQPPKRALPSRRVSVASQLRLVAAGAAASGAKRSAFHLGAAAEKTGLSTRQAALGVRFLIEVGLWTQDGREVYRATATGRQVGRLWDTDQDRARTLLGKLLQDHWSAEVLRARLADGPIALEGLLEDLRRAAGAHEQHHSMLMGLVEWLGIARLLDQGEDGRVRAGRLLVLRPTPPAAVQDEPVQPPQSQVDHQVDDDPTDLPREPIIPQQKEPDPVHQATSTRSAEPDTPAGPYALNVDVRLTWEEISALDPDDLARFVKVLAITSKARREACVPA